MPNPHNMEVSACVCWLNLTIVIQCIVAALNTMMRIILLLLAICTFLLPEVVELDAPQNGTSRSHDVAASLATISPFSPRRRRRRRSLANNGSRIKHTF